MKRVCVIVLFAVLAATSLYADTQDDVVFRTRLLPENEIPPVFAPGNSANATITVHVTRDDRGNVNAATVTFDVDYTLSSAVTFTGLHIHNAPAGQNGGIVIDTGITGTNTVSAAAGTGKITRVVNYASTDANGIRFVTGLLATPANYYVNIHTSVNPSGLMRGQLQSSRLVFRPAMSPAFEVPAVNIDAEGAALIDVRVNRDPQTGAITSGTVLFDVEYRFPAPVTITGLHIHNAAFGSNGPIVIDTGISNPATAVTGVTRGNLFRIAEVSSAGGIAALNGLFADPSQFYVNLHTTANPGGVIRGQLSSSTYAFFNLMTQAEENPPTGVPGTANSMMLIGVNRDSTGNIASGAVSFNITYNMGSVQTFTGLHIHRGKIGVNGPVVIDTRLNAGGNVVTHEEGVGFINREVQISPTETNAFEALRGLLENPENYYVNIHTTQFGGGVVRAQLSKETYYFKTNMSTANEVPPVTGVDTAATGWVTARMIRNANGTLTGGTVTFDVNFTNSGPITFVGLHIHFPGPAGILGPVTINTLITGGNSVVSTSGSGNITRVVEVPSTNVNGIATLNALITAPETAYINLHSTTFGGGVVRSQMRGVVNTVADAVGGGEWLTSITIRNPSDAAVQGIVNFFKSDGSLMPAAIVDPNISFLIPASGSITISTHNKGDLAVGFAKIFSNGEVTAESSYISSSFPPNTQTGKTVTARSVSVPISVGVTPPTDTGVAIVAGSSGTLTFVVRNQIGIPLPGTSRIIDVTAGQHISAFVRQLVPAIATWQVTGTLTITASSGTISALALQFDGTVTPVTVTPLP
jgi:hypothetical protein